MSPSRRWSLALLVGLGLTAVSIPSAVAFKRYRDARHRATLADFLASPNAGEERWVERSADADQSPGRIFQADESWDDPFRRAIAWRNLWGTPNASLAAEWAREARRESSRWASLLPRAPRSAGEARSAMTPSAAVSGLAWVSLGPSNANFEYNGSQYTQVDSGRASGLLVDPRDPATVYLATSGGGIWKTFEFGATNPTWFPITETLGNLAIGAMDLDPSAPDTLYVGLGDFVDTPGGQVVKSADGGATWSAPVALTGTTPSGLSVTALRIRALKVDPANPAIVLAGTDVGLFRSVNGGASFTLVDLPNAGGGVLAESIWSIVYTGQVNGVSRWAVSGVYASSPTALPPFPGLGTASNPGDVWVSTDAGASFASRKAAGGLPATAAGRIELAAGTPSNASPPVTVVYAQVALADETQGGGGLWRSTDSGASFSAINGTLRNPTTSSNRCTDVHVNGAQAWYNSAIAVDPLDSSRVIVGGIYCGLRTVNGLAANPVWENVAFWLPTSGTGDTAEGRLPYVHGEWQEALIVRTPTGYRVLVGSDGGLFYSENVFNPSVLNDTTVTWAAPNRGLVTHLAYAVGSGDPADGNPSIAIAGLQDNGTRFRDPSTPTTFNQVVGGDGLGTVVTHGANLTAYWSSSNGGRRFCTPSTRNCNSGPAWDYGWDPPIDTCPGDQQSLFVRLSPISTSAVEPAILTITDQRVWRVVGDPNDLTVDYVPVSPCAPAVLRNIHASPSQDGLYGAPTNGGTFWVSSDCTLGAGSCTWTISASAMGFDANGDSTVSANERILGAASLTFPPTTPSGKSPGDVYVVSSVATQMADGSPVNPAVGRVFITQDRGATWTPLHGNGTGFDLPSVPVNVIRFDPGDATNNTLYAGTDLGVYRSTDAGQTWHRFGSGMPLVKVTDLFIAKAGGLLRVATYGRGLWEIYPNAAAARGVSGNGDFDRNQLIDYRDLTALSSRLGTDPTTSTPPYYDWNVDLVGSANAVNESDLDQLLQRFGGRP